VNNLSKESHSVGNIVTATSVSSLLVDGEGARGLARRHAVGVDEGLVRCVKVSNSAEVLVGVVLGVQVNLVLELLDLCWCLVLFKLSRILEELS